MTENQTTNKSLVDELTDSYLASQQSAAPAQAHQALQPAPTAPVEAPEPDALDEVAQLADAPEAEQELAEPTVAEKQERNWKEMRSLREQAEKERDEAIRYARAVEQEAYRYQQQVVNQRTQAPVEPDFDINSLNDEEYVDAKQIKKIIASENRKRKQVEDNMARQQQMSYEAAVSAQLKIAYPDFDNVLTPQNIEALRTLRPGLARSLANNPDLAEKARETYNLIKDLGIHQEPVAPQPQPRPAPKIANRPRSANSVGPQYGDTPLNNANVFANGLTPELKKALWEDMQKKRSSW